MVVVVVMAAAEKGENVYGTDCISTKDINKVYKWHC
jgi:hypothetical protein